jgi:hypothetical protein
VPTDASDTLAAIVPQAPELPGGQRAVDPGEATAPKDPSPIVATLHYFRLTNAYHCAVCKEPTVDFIRVAQTTAGETVITPMCEGCADTELTGVLEREEMVVDGKGTHLVAPFIHQVAEQFGKR